MKTMVGKSSDGTSKVVTKIIYTRIVKNNKDYLELNEVSGSVINGNGEWGEVTMGVIGFGGNESQSFSFSGASFRANVFMPIVADDKGANTTQVGVSATFTLSTGQRFSVQNNVYSESYFDENNVYHEASGIPYNIFEGRTKGRWLQSYLKKQAI